MDKTAPAMLSWDEYARPPVSMRDWAASRRVHAAAFENQRRIIRELLAAQRPRRVACLGAGYLNDLPVDALLAPERENLWVDWIAGIAVDGVRGTAISGPAEHPSCMFCSCPTPQRYCTGFIGPVQDGAQVCTAFEAVPEPSLHCARYAPGNEPAFVVHDVTSGRATRFARRAEKIVRSSAKPEEAFHRAMAECSRWAGHREPIPAPDASMDFITSSMVVSQFDAEPYTYFSKLLELQFGRDAILQKADRMEPLMEELRTELFRVQMEGHAEELRRLVREDGGRVYFSVEIFRTAPTNDRFFLVHEIPKALDILGTRFHFDFAAIPPNRAFCEANLGGGDSIMFNALLVPR